MPGEEIVFVAVVFPAPQSKAAPTVIEEALSTTLVTVQVSTAGAAILAFGAVIFCVTVAEEAIVQPLAGFVTVTT